MYDYGKTRTYTGGNHCSGAYSLNSPKRCESYEVWEHLKIIRTFLRTKIAVKIYRFLLTFWECGGKGKYR